MLLGSSSIFLFTRSAISGGRMSISVVAASLLIELFLTCFCSETRFFNGVVGSWVLILSLFATAELELLVTAPSRAAAPLEVYILHVVVEVVGVALLVELVVDVSELVEVVGEELLSLIEVSLVLVVAVVGVVVVAMVSVGHFL